MMSVTDLDMFLSEIFQLRDELIDFGEAVSDERLATVILYALPEEMYSILQMRSTIDPELGFEEIISIIKTIFINYSERFPVTERSQEPYRKSLDNSGREPRMKYRE